MWLILYRKTGNRSRVDRIAMCYVRDSVKSVVVCSVFNLFYENMQC